MFTLLRPLPQNAPSLIDVTLDGILIEARPEQILKALYPIFVTVSGISTDLSPLHPKNVY